MPKRCFEVEWDEPLEELWMNAPNLGLCLSDNCPNTKFRVRDVTNDGKQPDTVFTSGPRYGDKSDSVVIAIDEGATMNQELMNSIKAQIIIDVNAGPWSQAGEPLEEAYIDVEYIDVAGLVV